MQEIVGQQLQDGPLRVSVAKKRSLPIGNAGQRESNPVEA